MYAIHVACLFPEENSINYYLNHHGSLCLFTTGGGDANSLLLLAQNVLMTLFAIKVEFTIAVKRVFK